MATVPTFRPIAGAAPTSDDVALREFIAAQLAKNASAPRNMPAGTSTNQALGHGAIQVAEALMARNARNTAVESKNQYRDHLAKTNEPLVDQLSGGDAGKRDMLAKAIAGMNPEVASQALSQSALNRALAVPDPSLALRRDEMEGAREDRRLAREQAAENLKLQIASREQAGKDSAALRLELAKMQDATRRELGDQTNAIKQGELDRKKEADAAKGKSNTDAASAKAFLDGVKYDPKTGEDDITKLLKGATGGFFGNLVDSSVRAVGGTMPGAAANAALKSRASESVLNFLGGKLGAGVSNADRDFMMQRAGDIGNEKLSVGERLAAWQDVQKRMASAAGIVPGASAPAAAARTFATPEEAEASGYKGDAIIAGRRARID